MVACTRWLLVIGLAGTLVGCSDGVDSARSAIDDAEQADGCTLTQGFWKNHEEDWPVDTLTLGTVSYDKAELLAILGTPVRGNGLLALAHQLIAAKLNVASGAADGAVDDAIAAADALIGDLVAPPVGDGRLPTGSALVGELDDFNNGRIGPGHCDDGPPPPPDDDPDPPCGCDDTCGDGTLDAGEACDDGNNVDGDGCSSTCELECGDEPPPGDPDDPTEPPLCGNGQVDPGEACDWGNDIDQGCAADCQSYDGSGDPIF